MSKIICNKCKTEISSANYVKCYTCNSSYHFSTCCSLSESTYSTMHGERKTNWKCHVCRPKARSPNTLYQAVVFEDTNHQKQQRDVDESDNEGNRVKVFKDSLSLNSLNSSICSVQSDVTELKSNMRNIKDKLDQMGENFNTSHQKINEEIKTALTTITNTLSQLAVQVNQLSEKDTQREKRINEMDSRINKLEQQVLARNIEIKNVNNKDLAPYEVVKNISASLNIEIKESDIANAYKLEKKSNKIVIEFSSINKKKELMSKLNRHRVDAHLINSCEENNSGRYIYINDELTARNRNLLWIAKTKAKESNWKFVWIKDGRIFARRNENGRPIVINNSSDIELITSDTN